MSGEWRHPRIIRLPLSREAIEAWHTLWNLPTCRQRYNLPFDADLGNLEKIWHVGRRQVQRQLLALEKLELLHRTKAVRGITRIVLYDPQDVIQEKQARLWSEKPYQQTGNGPATPQARKTATSATPATPATPPMSPPTTPNDISDAADVAGVADVAGRQRVPGGETPNNVTKENSVEKRKRLHQRSKEQLGSNGTMDANGAPEPVHFEVAATEVLQARVRALQDFDAVMTPAARRERIIARLEAAAPNLDPWFARYVAGQVECGAIRPEDIGQVIEEMRQKDQAAKDGLTTPIDDRGAYLRSLISKLHGCVPPKRKGDRRRGK